MDVADWLRGLGLQRYEAAFDENGVSADVLCHLTADDLKELGVTGVGDRRRLLVAIAALRPNDSPSTADPIPLSSHPPIGSLGSSETTAERRPISVMFCDLIGSTALSSRLDPEDLREVIRAYQACVADTIRQFYGFIARYVGDGVLIYFGWPEARETDAERAVRAGLAVATAVGEMTPAVEPLHVRVGIATGLVVIGEPIGSGDSRQQTAVGETPNLAARLQGLAGPNQVVIDAATRRQIGGLFECRDLGTLELKGLPTAVPTWMVLAENRALGQFEALRSGATPLIGRDEETDLLLRRWGQAQAGSGRVVLISAEPGVGKSRLAEALAGLIAGEPHVQLRYFCSPHHQDSALYPVIAQMERAAGFQHADTPSGRLAKLQALLGPTTPPIEDVALIAELLALPSADLAPRDLTPQRKKEKIFEALLRQVQSLSQQQPVLMLFDDIHWIDPSSRELLDRMIERVADWPALLLVMFRPEFQPPWIGQPHVTTLALTRLDRRDTAAMVANVAGDIALSSDIVEEIAERTDGVPLFVEELTKAVLESGSQASAALSSVPNPGVTVPATLHASLMARLDRLGSAAREIAQAGAAIGREFTYEVLASIIDLSEPQLGEALDRLSGAGLVFARGTPPDASYLFKHTLVQDAAYSSLLRGRRQHLHRRITTALEERFPEVAQVQLALMAQHCAAAGLAEEAVAYWRKAAQQAAMRGAMVEAAAQARKGLETLTALPEGLWRREQQLELQIVLNQGLMITKGFAATETVNSLAQAQELATQLDRPEHEGHLMFGQWGAHLSRGEYRAALSLGKQLEAVGELRNEPTTQLFGRMMQGFPRLLLGELVAARDLLQEHTDPDHTPGDLEADYLHAMKLTGAGRALLYLGYIDQARSRIGNALSQSRQTGNAPILAMTLTHATALDFTTGSPLLQAEELLALTTEHKLPYWLGLAMAFRGMALATEGKAQEAHALLTQAVAQRHAIGTLQGLPGLLARLANVTAMLGRPVEAWNYLADAAQLVEATDERLYETYVLHQVPGDLLKAAGDQLGAERHYRQAIATAKRQSAKLFQLRASTSLARLWRDQGKPAKAYNLLAHIYGWFTEGLDTPILKEAKALLDELAS